MSVTRTLSVVVTDLELNDRCQARESINPEVVRDYAERDDLPPVEVWRVDADDLDGGGLVVTDGWHRVLAARAAGRERIEVLVVGEGSIDQAAWHAVTANQRHGLRRTNADKRKAVWQALDNPIGQEQSSRCIAEHVGVSADFVARLRKQWEQDNRVPVATEVPAQSKRRAGRVSSDDTPGVATNDTEPLPGDGTPLDDEPSSDPRLSRAAEDAVELERVLREARRRVAKLAEGGGLMVSHARTVAAELLTLARGVGQWVPVEHAECGGEGCRVCQHRGWVRRMNVGGRRAS